IAKLLSGHDDDHITVAVERRLTPTYAAPEQAAGQPASVATDIYSLGALLYELLTNQPPQCASSPNNFPQEDNSTPVRCVTDARRKHELEGQLAQIVQRAMEKEPVKRYPSVTDLAAEIEQYVNGKAASTTVARLGVSGTKAKARRRWYITAPIVGIVLLTAALVLLPGKIASLKNYTITHRTAPVSSAATPDDSIHSIGVLPFEPLGQDTNDELLGLGMADAVIGRMSNLKQVAVLPTSAVSKYKGAANDPIAAGHALGVDAVLSGTIQRSGDRIRATVQLVRVATGRTVWSDKFDQTFTDIFGLQDAISDSIAKSLALNLSADEQKQLVKHYTTNAAAYGEYLMGLYFYSTRSRDGFNKAIDHFGRAIEKDPNFALAYALMSDCYFLQMYYRYDSKPARVQNAKAAAERALSLDDSIAEAHVALANVQFDQEDHQGGMDSLRRALALNPNLAIAHQRYAWALCSSGQLDNALREMKRAQELDPLSPTNNTALGVV